MFFGVLLRAIKVEELYNRIDRYFLEYVERRKFYLKVNDFDSMKTYYDSMCYYAQIVDNFSIVLENLDLLPDGVSYRDISDCL